MIFKRLTLPKGAPKFSSLLQHYLSPTDYAKGFIIHSNQVYQILDSPALAAHFSNPETARLRFYSTFLLSQWPDGSYLLSYLTPKALKDYHELTSR